MSDISIHDRMGQANTPVAPLCLLVHPSAQAMGEKVNSWIREFRKDDNNEYKDEPMYIGYYKDDYRTELSSIRFETGEGRVVLMDSVRGKDVYILVDITNYSITYEMNGFTNHMSPDDHFQDLKRVISAVNGTAHRINVIMPFLYEGRQHHRNKRESMDAAIMYKELCDLGIKNFITFDAHDPRIQNADPLVDFSNFSSPYQFLRTLIHNEKDLTVDKDHIVVIAPDEGALDRSVYFANVIGADTGMFYKRRDYSKIVGGKNPIVAHEFLGTDLNGKDAIIIDDMVSSGGSILDTSRQLKLNMHAKRVFLCTTFGLFTDGLAPFDEAYEKGYFDRLVTTNLTYLPEELLQREWYAQADMSKYMATIIDFINHDSGITNMSTSNEKIHNILKKMNLNQQTVAEERQLDMTEF